MLYFLMTWNLLAIVCWMAGISLLNLLQVRCFDRIGDRAIVSIWSGIVLLSISWLAASFIVPLSPIVGLTVAGIFMVVALRSKRTWDEIAQLKAAYSIRWLIAIFCLALLTAVLIDRPMVWFDSGGYHIGLIRWLAQAGTVPGLALINYAFGFTSSWFAFAAPLVPEILGHHLGAVTNGFVFFLAALHVLIALFHFRVQDCRVVDGFAIAVYLPIVAIYTATLFTASPILVSFSPDVPVTLLVGMIAWTILGIKEADRKSQFSSRTTELRSAIFDVKMLPLVLGLGAFSFKLSAMPALAIVLLFYGFEVRFALKKLSIAAALAIVLSAPMLGYGVMTSACPLFPSTKICLDLPWRYPEEIANKHLRETKVLNLEESESSNSTSALVQRFLWIRTQRKMQIMLLLYAASIGVSLRWFFSNQYKIEAGLLWVSGLGLLGMTFIIFYAPLIRFGLIYFIVIPALFFARLATSQVNAAPERFRISSRFSSFLYRVGIGVTCVLFLILGQRNLVSILPPELPKPNLIQAQTNDINYAYPAEWTYRCWASALPCSGVPIKNVRLRDPQRGMRAGFVFDD